MKVAFVHYWLVGMRGGERVLEALSSLYPDAVIITHVVDRDKISAQLRKHEIRETFIAKLPGARRHYQKYLPLMPIALESVDMSEFDLVISSESGPAKGIVCRPDAVHICYCHSPMRYIWDQYHVYRSLSGSLTKFVMPWLAHKLRVWDVTSAARVDAFIANSSFVGQRIESYYRRPYTVVHPPVAIEEFSVAPIQEIGKHYLFVGELVGYKRADIAVEAFSRLGLPLRIVGDGEQRRRLERSAPSNVSFLGRVTFSQLKEELAQCRALIFPGEEDFGIVPVEAMAAGRPVIAYGRGGVLDSIIPGVTGHFFHEQTSECLEEAIRLFEADGLKNIKIASIVAQSKKFSVGLFNKKVQNVIATAISEKSLHRPVTTYDSD